MLYVCIETCFFSNIFKGGNKLERTRDLFEQVLDGCPAKYAKGVCHDLLNL